MPAILTRGYHPAHDVANKKGSAIGKFDGSQVALKTKVVDVCIKRGVFVLRAIDLNNLIQIIWICMFHKRSAESAKSEMPVFSRRILGSAKACKSGSYLSSFKWIRDSPRTQ